MPDKKVLWMLDELEGFEKPKIKLEQYATSSELAGNILENIESERGQNSTNLQFSYYSGTKNRSCGRETRTPLAVAEGPTTTATVTQKYF
ncbi:hypothetical protein B9Z55_010144 [Caenorhabditis nigoni]|uniref:Uncharacterized protein n=1 Tax=Caenorhabditis nigoni TaxID=1611254 RepID=A0A2G5UF67_9PELO|nr:hypothetical protein B9Z55_010144 [Caenorhabditis nigoni]